MSSSDAIAEVVIVGAGPGGAGLAYLLARRGVAVTLLERRTDSSREFRGEVLMPSGLDALAQMGLAEELAQIEGHLMQSASILLNDTPIVDVELAGLSPPLSIRAVSQPALLEALITKALAYPNFVFRRGAAVKDLMRNAGGRITGVRYSCDGELHELRATLVVGADGRNSAVRKLSGISNAPAGAAADGQPMDIVWCKLPCPKGWNGVKAYAGRGHLLVAYRTWGNNLQIGWVILKGTFGELRQRGMPEWVDKMADHVSPDLAKHLRTHRDDVQKPFLLDVVSDCVDQWSIPGVLLIGDAAHTMSPVGAQGINLALRDAIVAANGLAPLFDREQGVAFLQLDEQLKAIERERMPEVSRIQALQAAPPKLVLSRSWWGEPLRWLASQLLKVPVVRTLAAQRAQSFLFGETNVRLDR